jgi:hypothetical protein
VWLPGCGDDDAPAPAPGTEFADFLDEDEMAIVRAATARLFPSDGGAGAAEADVATYIQRLLSAFPVSGDGAPRIFGGGPFSGRTPFLDEAAMAPSNRFPENSFDDFVPLTRVQTLAWRARLEGAETIPELAANPLLDPDNPDAIAVGLQSHYRDGIAEIEATSQRRFSRSFVDLSGPEQDAVLADAAVRGFTALLLDHTLEGLLAAPEYGGNRDGVGWDLIGYGGDSQPRGYTFGFDEQAGRYVESHEMPNSAPNPEETCAGVSAEVEAVLRILLGTQEGFREFDEPVCFDVAAALAASSALVVRPDSPPPRSGGGPGRGPHLAGAPAILAAPSLTLPRCAGEGTSHAAIAKNRAWKKVAV